ncbi:MAG TPA: protein kinase [Vicinamibacterales bacterium]|nr:protein kinase [Vicinamibacterales bacterium]
MLSPGSQVGAYHVVALLGAGGMGEVYLAEDTRLRRRVALKVLPATRSDDETSQKRLLREAQTAAALEHPNICTVYDVGETDGHSYIAMQYVEGETLASRMARQPLDIATAISVATQIARALAEAHRQGIVHRDLKPQNVMLTTANQVKVLDFGLAKITSLADGSAATVTLLTEDGAIAGTVPYMSPEQVRGDTLDARTDIFSFGSLLFEMVGRAHPFASGTPADTMSAILTREAPTLSPAVPAELQRIVRKCLEKDRDRRYQTVRDLLIDLENLAGPRPALPRPRGSRTALLAGIAAAVIAVTLAVVFWPRPGARLPLSSATFEQLTNLPDVASAPVLSPDGRMVAFIRGDWFLSTGQIYVKLLPSGEAVQLTNDVRPKYAPTFSPDGSRVAYTVIDADREHSSWDTYTVPVLGGTPTRLLPNAAGLTWIGGRRVLFSEVKAGSGLHMGLVTAGEDRSDRREIYFPSHERGMAHLSYLSPNQKSILSVEMDGTGTFQPCRVVPFDGSSPGQVVGPVGSCTGAAWSADGNWMFLSVIVNGVGHLWREGFPNGPLEQLTSGSATEELGIAMAPDSKSLITSVGRTTRSLWVHEGQADRLLSIEGYDSGARASADGQRLYCLIRPAGASSERGLAVMDVASGRVDRLLADFPILDFDVSRDERQVVFTTRRDGEQQIWLADLDRRSPPRQIATNGDRAHFGRAQHVLYRASTGRENYIHRIDLSSSSPPQRAVEMPVLHVGNISPDGEWLIATRNVESLGGVGTVAIPVYGGEPRLVCRNWCSTEWSADGKHFLTRPPQPNGRTLAVRLAPGQMLPATFPEVPDIAGWTKTAGVEVLDRDAVVAGPSLTSYVFEKSTQLRNLYRVQLR